MDYLEFSSLTEKDFDEIIFNAGGKRYTNNSSIQKGLNCDYILDDAVIELKIIEEEPIEKKQKQEKFVKLFPAYAETVLLIPTKEQKYEYYKILESPIKSALKKASKQLKKSAKDIGAKLRIAIIINNGLYMVSQKEFREIALKRAKNDTSGIDILIIASMHYYSDKFDMIVLFEFKDFEINKIKYENKKSIIESLRKAWNEKTQNYMTEQLVNSNLKRGKMPIQDLYFEYNGIQYIKPSIQWGEDSKWCKNGRPRLDSTKEKDIPQILVIPTFDNENTYNYVKENLYEKNILRKSLREYNDWIENNPIDLQTNIQLFLNIELTLKDLNLIKLPFYMQNIQDLAYNKVKKFRKQLIDSLEEFTPNINSNNFILIEVEEIGMDKANDISYISHITNDPKSKKSIQEDLVNGKRIDFENAVELGIALCIALKADKVTYVKDETYKWK